VHISYLSYLDWELKYALNASGSWVVETVDSSRLASATASVAVDSADNVHITYVGPQGLMYRTNASGSWVTETIDSEGKWGPSIAVDSSGKVHISYSTYSCSVSISCLKYATNASGSWVSEMLDSMAKSNTSIAIDSSDKVHISYYDSFFDGSLMPTYLQYTTNASGSWVFERVDGDYDIDAPSIIDTPSMAIDSSDNVHISYSFAYYNTIDWMIDHVQMRYATNAPGSWIIETVDETQPTMYYSMYPSIAIDSSDNLHISYNNDYGLKYATNASGSWVSETVDDNGSEPSFIAIDSSDNVHISYSDTYPDYKLKYATNASGSWVSETVAIYGGAISMAVDSSDYVHIVYYDNKDYDLKYATNKPLPDISVTDSVDPADDLLIPFGDITKCSLSGRPVTVTNTGDANLVIGSVYLTGTNQDQFGIRNDTCSGAAISPSGTCTIDVVFSPTEAGELRAVLGIDSNDPDTPSVEVELAGTGVQLPYKVSGKGMNHPAARSMAMMALDVSASSPEAGRLKYYYSRHGHGRRGGLTLESTSITGLSVGCYGDAAITGTGTVKGTAGYTFTATVTDGGPDSMGIEIYRPDGTLYFSAEPEAVRMGDFVIEEE